MKPLDGAPTTICHWKLVIGHLYEEFEGPR
jgi:hypothetical protein